MLKGTIIVDSLCRIWHRGYIELTEEDAIKTPEELAKAIETGDITFLDSGYIFETVEDIAPEDVGYSTLEIYQDSPDSKPIYENGKSNFIPDTSE